MLVGGFAGTLLRVDLSEGEIRKEALDMDLARSFLGGKGLGAKILYDELEAGIDPLSSESIFIIATGPLTGTFPGATKYAVVAKSPLTGTFLDAQSGGSFGPSLKLAGYDALVFTGRAEKPVYIWIYNEQVEIRDAQHLWGRTTHETEDQIKKELKESKASVASIGPAGEKMVRLACVTNDLWRQAGRGGAGAIMGSKNLKAIAVRGTKRIRKTDPVAFKEAVKGAVKTCLKPGTYDWAMTTGTTTGMNVYTEAGVFPTKNFQTGVFQGIDKINGEAIRAKYAVKNVCCGSCPYRCGQLTAIKEGPYAGTMLVGPEYETLSLLGGNCGIDSLEAIMRANLLCDQLGLDTMSAGGVIAFAMECYERGIITKEDTGDLDLKFGNAEAMVRMVERISFREGIGDILAEGVVPAARRFGKGSEKYAVHVKGMTLAGYEPRGLFGTALAYATADRGGCHTRACPADKEIAGVYDRFSPEGKGKLVKSLQDDKAVKDALGVCKFLPIELDHHARLLSALTGWSVTEEDLLKIGERIYNLTRLFNVREGFTRKDDHLPERLMTEPMPEGTSKGYYIKREYMDRMLDDYYAARGWDANGIPTNERLGELELEV